MSHDPKFRIFDFQRGFLGHRQISFCLGSEFWRGSFFISFAQASLKLRINFWERMCEGYDVETWTHFQCKFNSWNLLCYGWVRLRAEHFCADVDANSFAQKWWFCIARTPKNSISTHRLQGCKFRTNIVTNSFPVASCWCFSRRRKISRSICLFEHDIALCFPRQTDSHKRYTDDKRSHIASESAPCSLCTCAKLPKYSVPTELK